MNRIFASLIFAAALAAFAPSFALAQEVNLRRTVVVEVVQRTKDAVVNISAEKLVSQRVSLFGGVFWEGGPSEIVTRKANSLGSGFIIHEDGYVVTNDHVIDRAERITVELADGRQLPASLISANREADLAILKISDAHALPVLELGDSSDLMIGEPVIAVGNPLGYSHTVSTGIVSALHRDLKDSQGNTSLTDLIQTDAAINPGNSGGPLLNAYGQVIGINTAIRSDAQNIGFAIGIDRLRDLIGELMNPAQANKVDIPVHLAEHRTLTPPDHVRAEITAADHPDRVLESIDGHHPRDIVDAYALLLRVKAGDRPVIAWSDGSRQTLLATAIPLPDPIAIARKRLGLSLQPVTPAVARKYNLQVDNGMLVHSVARGSAGDRALIAPGDVLIRLGSYPVATLDDLSALIQLIPTSGRVRFVVVRQSELGAGWFVFGDADQQ